MKKNFFERIGLIESDEGNTIATVIMTKPSNVECNVPVYDETPCDLIQKIYEDNGLSNCEVSVYKVEDLIESLPKETPEKTRKVIVTNLLSTLKLSVTDINDDAFERINVLQAVRDQIVNNNNEQMAQLSAEIQSMKEQIEQFEMKIEQLDVENSKISNGVASEIDKMNDLLAFIAPEEVETNASK